MWVELFLVKQRSFGRKVNESPGGYKSLRSITGREVFSFTTSWILSYTAKSSLWRNGTTDQPFFGILIIRSYVSFPAAS